jgi:hypothetical protein
MNLHFVEHMDEVLKIALVSEPKPLPISANVMEPPRAEAERAH